MATSGTLKMKMLALWEILRQESDAARPLSTNDLCRKLRERGISCERKSIATDIELLRAHGFEVKSEKIGRERVYYMVDRTFDAAELKIIIDALQAASFVTEKQTAELTEKIAALGGSHRANILKGSLVHFNTRKHTNESTLYSVNELEEALLRKCQASFYYFDLNENHERVYRKEQKLYVVDPAALIFHEDNYYLMCYSTKYQRPTVYRVDRMENVNVVEHPVSLEARLSEEQIAAFVEQTFKMFSGDPAEVTLRFADDKIGTVYDKFGEDTEIRRIDEDTCEARVAVQISPTFWGWLFQFNGEMQIIDPPELIDTYRSMLDGANK